MQVFTHQCSNHILPPVFSIKGFWGGGRHASPCVPTTRVVMLPLLKLLHEESSSPLGMTRPSSSNEIIVLKCQRAVITHHLFCLIQSVATCSSGSVLICAGRETDILWGNGTIFLVLPIGLSTILSVYNRGAVDIERHHVLETGLLCQEFKGRCCWKVWKMCHSTFML